MKLIALLPLFLVLLSGCGDELAGRKKLRSTMGSPLTQEQFVSASLVVPAADSFGGAITIQYNGISYLIGSQTDPIVTTIIQKQAPGTYRVELRGQTAKETGHPQNPTAIYDVIHILEIR